MLLYVKYTSMFFVLQRFLEALVGWLNEKASSQLYVACLEAIRIISREKTGLDAVTTEKALKILLNHAGLDMSCLAEENDCVTIQDVFGISCHTFLCAFAIRCNMHICYSYLTNIHFYYCRMPYTDDFYSVLSNIDFTEFQNMLKS